MSDGQEWLGVEVVDRLVKRRVDEGDHGSMMYQLS